MGQSTLIVAHHNATERKRIVKWLDAAGHTSVPVSNVSSARQAVRSAKADLLLLDMELEWARDMIEGIKSAYAGVNDLLIVRLEPRSGEKSSDADAARSDLETRSMVTLEYPLRKSELIRCVHFLTRLQRAERGVQQGAERLTALVAAQQEIVSAGSSPDTIMRLVAAQAQKLTHADGATVELVEGTEMVYRAASGLAAALAGTRLKIGEGLSDLCVRTEEIIRCEDIGTAPRADQILCGRLGARSLAIIPLRHQYNSLGVLKIFSAAPRSFTRADLEVLQLIVHFMAAAINQAVASDAKQALLAEHTRTIVALRESEERFRNAFDYAAIGMGLVGTDGRWMKVNRTLCQIVGFSEQEMRSLKFADLMHAEDLTQYEEYSARLLAGEVGSFQMEARSFDKAGSIVWVLLTVSLLRDGQGKPLYYIAQIQDISVRKRAEEALIMQASVLQNMSEGVCLMDEAQAIVYTNAAHERMFGYREDELRGQPITKLNSYPPEENSRLASEIFDHVQTHGLWSGELKNVSKKGRVFTTATNISLLEISARRYFVCVQEDITEKKRADEQIKNSLREKDVMLKEIHHRVKNNLQVISSLLNLQSGYIQDQRTHELFRDSQNRVRSMALIHEKLYQSQDLARIDVAEYVLSLVSMLFRSYGTNSGAVKLDLQIAPVTLNIDTAIPVGLLLNELVSNSLKYAFPDGQAGTICIDFRGVNNDEYALVFRDDGIGMPRDFDFDRSPSLGLRLVKILTNQIGGELTFDRSRGTKFTIKFREPKEKRN